MNLKSQLPIIVEVGTWKGQSAINMANILKKNDIKGKIYCIDTFLGTWDLQEKECKNGYSQVYYMFLNNVVYENVKIILFHAQILLCTGIKNSKR